jgi:hypothetical protein
VGVAALEFSQDGLRIALLFAVALFFFVCYGVGYAFFSTRHTWLYVEGANLWV